MSFLLAKLGPVVEPGLRQVSVRGGESVASVPDSLPRLQQGDLVLIDGAGPPWRVAHTVTHTPWPAQLPDDVDTMRRARRAPVTAMLGGILSSTGTWTVDPEGRPCEVGFGRSGGPVFAIINYSGWKLSDLERGAAEIVPCSVGGHELWIVTAKAVSAPPAPEPTPIPRAPPAAPVYASGHGGFGFRPAAPEAPPAPLPWQPPPPPVEVPFDLRLHFRDLTFQDGSVQFRFREQVLTVETDLAREVYNDVRQDLDNELPEGVRAVGTLHRDGSARCELRGLEKLATIFHRVKRARFIRAALDATGWLDAEDLAAKNPAGAGGGPSAVLDIPEFNFERRAEAFRRMFTARAPGEPVRVLPGRAVVVALVAADGGRPWFAWEKTTGDYATYLFRPSDDEQRDRMLAWTEDRESRRRDLLADKALRRELGFVVRVMHRDARGDELAGWWRRLSRAIGGSGA